MTVTQPTATEKIMKGEKPMTRAGRGGKPVLTEAQFAEAVRREKLRRENSRQRVAHDLGCSTYALRNYLQGFRPKKWNSSTTTGE